MTTVKPMRQAGKRYPSWPQFLAWALVPNLLLAGLAAAFTPLIIVVVPAAAVLVTALIVRCGVNQSAIGAIFGAGILPLVVGYLNRGGPGDVCTASNGGSQCTSEWSPWPFVVVGLVLVITGVTWFDAARRR
jgi:uncharacterized membrane protein